MEVNDESKDEGIIEDMISQLPDPILHQILSYLHTKNAVRTMMVSRRWRDLWDSMPYFQFHGAENEIDADSEDEKFPAKGGQSKFARFVDLLLRRRDASNIHAFRLQWACGSSQLGQNYLGRWTKHVVTRNAKIIEIAFTLGSIHHKAINLPHCIFACKSMEELTLEFHGTIASLQPPQSFVLARLRKLFLESIRINCGLRELIYACPVLEELEIRHSTITDADVSSDMLKRLKILGCHIMGGEIQVSAPNLKFLHFTCNNTECSDSTLGFQVLLGDLSSLVDASIDLDDNYSMEPFKFSSLSEKVIIVCFLR